MRDARGPALLRPFGALAVCLLAALPAGAAAAPPSDPESLIAGSISSSRARDHVRALAAFGARMGGTASGGKAARWAAGVLEGLGLAVEIEEDPPLDAWEAVSWEAGLLAPEARPLVAWPARRSPSLAASAFDLREEAPRPVAGPFVLLTGAAPREAAERGREAGAAAVLTDAGDPDLAAADVAPARALDEGAAVPVWTLSPLEGKRLRDRLAAGPVRVRLSLTASAARRPPLTVLATLPGTTSAWFLVCAHGDSDSGGPGADDNASGVASLLEAAAGLAAAARAGALPASRPSVLFAIWGAEIHSTRAFVLKRAGGMERLLGVFNYDQTAGGVDEDAIYFEGNDIPWNGALLNALLDVARQRAGRDDFTERYTTNPSLGGTDADVFLPRSHRGAGLVETKVPVVTVFTAAWGRPRRVRQTPGWDSPGWPSRGEVRIDWSPVYHSSGDVPEATADRWPGRMARCARAVALAIRRLMEPAAGSGPGDPPPPAER